MHCYESVDGLPLAAVTVRRFKLLLKRIWVKVMFYNVLSHMHYFQASSVLHWFLVKCLIASWMQYNSVLSANMVYISKWYTAMTGGIRNFVRIWAGNMLLGAFWACGGVMFSAFCRAWGPSWACIWGHLSPAPCCHPCSLYHLYGRWLRRPKSCSNCWICPDG